MNKNILRGKSILLRGLIESDRSTFSLWKSDPDLKRQAGPGPFLTTNASVIDLKDESGNIKFAICLDDLLRYALLAMPRRLPVTLLGEVD